MRILGVLMAAAWFSLAQAAVYHVAPSGGDYTTISAAVNVAQAGDTVLVGTGVYKEKIISSRAGTAGNKIVIKSSPRRTANMQGFLIFHGYIRVEGFLMNGYAGVVNASYIDVVDNEINNAAVCGIEVKSGTPAFSNHDIYIAHNRIYHSNSGLGISGTKIMVENNEVDRLYQYTSGIDDDYCRFFGDSLTFRGNWFHGTVWNGSDYAEVPGAHVDCWQTFDDNGEHAKDMLFENNRCEDSHQGLMGEGIVHLNNSNFIFRNNVFRNTRALGLVFTQISNGTVFNNTFICSGGATMYYGVRLVGANATNITIKNNIFRDVSDDVVNPINGAVLPSGIDYNLYYRANYTFTPGSHDVINKDPLFVTADSNFHLRSTSPAIDAGIDVGLTYDFDGLPRPYGAKYDIGAYEYRVVPIRDPQPAINQAIPVAQPLCPNPVKTSFLYQYLQMKKDIKIYDMAGNVLDAGMIQKEGMYLVQANDQGIVQKLIVIR